MGRALSTPGPPTRRKRRRKARAHPLHVPYEETLSSIEIDGLFDGITYDKGASVIRMLRAKMSQGKSISSENLLKLDPFIQGLRAYLKEYR